MKRSAYSNAISPKGDFRIFIQIPRIYLRVIYVQSGEKLSRWLVHSEWLSTRMAAEPSISGDAVLLASLSCRPSRTLYTTLFLSLSLPLVILSNKDSSGRSFVNRTSSGGERRDGVAREDRCPPDHPGPRRAKPDYHNGSSRRNPLPSYSSIDLSKWRVFTTAPGTSYLFWCQRNS